MSYKFQLQKNSLTRQIKTDGKRKLIDVDEEENNQFLTNHNIIEKVVAEKKTMMGIMMIKEEK